MDQDVDLSPGHIMLDGDPVPPSERGTTTPTFWLMSVVAKRSPISATAELVFLFLLYMPAILHLLEVYLIQFLCNCVIS